MIVKFKNEEYLVYLNIDKVKSFGTEGSNKILFVFENAHHICKFKSVDDRDKALDRLEDYIRFQRLMCDLTDFYEMKTG